MDINLRHLRTFLEVAEAGSFRDASGQIHRSFSVVSTQVRQLEEQGKVQELIDSTINPAVAGHGGFVQLVDDVLDRGDGQAGSRSILDGSGLEAWMAAMNSTLSPYLMPRMLTSTSNVSPCLFFA